MEKPTLTITSYRGFLSFEMERDGKYLNDIEHPDQSGSVVACEDCVATQEAIDIIRNAPRDEHVFANIMLTAKNVPSYNVPSISVFGQGNVAISPENVTIGLLSDLAVLDFIRVDSSIQPSQEFINLVDVALDTEELLMDLG